MRNFLKKYPVFLILITVFCVLSKLLVSILFPLANILRLLFLSVFFIYIVGFCILNYKNFFEKKYYKNLLIFIIVFGFCWLPIDKQIEQSRFYLFKSAYTNMAKEIETELQSKDNTEYDTNQLYYPMQSMTFNNKKIFYIKQDSDMVIGIMVSESFFVRRDFVYFTSTRAREFIETDNKYDSFEWLQEPYWAYIKWY